MANGTLTGVAGGATAHTPGMSTGTAVFSTFGYLLLILGLLFLAYYLIRRFGPKAMGGAMGKDGPQVIGRTPLGQKQHLAVVQYREEELLLGVTEQNVTLLARYQAEDEPAPGTFAKLMGDKNDERDEGKDDAS